MVFKPATTDEKVNKLLEELEKERAEKKELKDKLDAKENIEKKEKDPMSGAGTLCEVVKITKSEAWQLPSRERYSEASRTMEMMSDPCPNGYQVKQGPNNTAYIVDKSFTNPMDAPELPNCRSKYTDSYEVYGPKKATDRGNFEKEPPKVEVHLCEKHAELFGARKKK